MTAEPPAAQVPRVGMFATVRNRRGVVSAVEPFDGDRGRLHLVHLEYKDDQHPLEERLLWELEPRKSLLEPTALPQATNSEPMPAQDFDALLRAARWTAASPFLEPDGKAPWTRLPISSPFHGAVQVEDFQLVPLLKALRMPRVNLLIADDVGLGKTVEAGLILSELLLRRRIQRVLILTPASLRLQWRDEMWDKFSLPFDLVDRGETHALRKRLGMDANPWRSFSRIIASYHYLRQDDVLRAVPRGMSNAGRIAAPAVGSADRRRVPQPDAVGVRRGQRPLPDAAVDRAAVRASVVPQRYAAQRAHALLHGTARDPRSGPLQPDRRTQAQPRRSASSRSSCVG